MLPLLIMVITITTSSVAVVNIMPAHRAPFSANYSYRSAVADGEGLTGAARLRVCVLSALLSFRI